MDEDTPTSDPAPSQTIWLVIGYDEDDIGIDEDSITACADEATAMWLSYQRNGDKIVRLNLVTIIGLGDD